jgi:flagella synthesis protein FlgN
MTLPDPSANLHSEQQIMQALQQLLLQEQATLINASIDGLVELMQAKGALVNDLGRHAKQRHAALAARGFNADESGMRDWVASAPSSETESIWNSLLEMTKEARELNRINGMLIGRHLSRNQSELNILQGKPHNSNFYGRDGQSTGTGVGRGLAIG